MTPNLNPSPNNPPSDEPALTPEVPENGVHAEPPPDNGGEVSGLYTIPEPRRRMRRRRRKGGLLRRILKRVGFGSRQRLAGVILGVFTILVIAVVMYAVLVADSLSRVNSSVISLERILTSLQSTSSGSTTLSMADFNRLKSGLSDVDESLASSQSRLAFVRPFQTIHPNIEMTFLSLDIAREITRATRLMINGAEPAANYLLTGTSTSGSQSQTTIQLSSGDRLVELLEIGRNPFQRARGILDQTQPMIDRLDLTGAPLELVRTSERIISFYEQINSVNQIFLNSTELLDAILGLNGDKTYLILAVNSDELRPSGGFLSTWGWLRVRGGRIVDFDYSASTTTSPTPPPRTTSTEFSIPNWWIQFRQPIFAAWDGSWYADFPQTADLAMWYYNTGENIHAPVDGVISIDIYGFEYLLGALGEITLPEYNNLIVTQNNFRRLVYDIRAYSSGPEPHKQFVADIYQRIMESWQSATRDPQRNTLILNALLRAAQEKHLMVHMAQDELNTAVDLLGWSGAQARSIPPGIDYLMVVDGNMSNKSSRSIRRSYIYDVTLNDDLSADKRITLNYEFPADVARNDPAVNPEFHGTLDYTSLVQIYAPQNSTLVDYSRDPGLPTESTLNDLWLISTGFTTPFDSARRLQYRYNTADAYIRDGNLGRYRLHIQKQPGTFADPITVQITLPPDTRLVESSITPSATFNIDRPVIEYALNLLVDRRIDIIFEYQVGQPAQQSDDGVPPANFTSG
jgi:hypothetical protein